MDASLQAARALHDEVVVVDLHADTPKLLHVFAWDLAVRHTPPLPRALWVGHVDVPRMRDGGLGAQFFGLWTFPWPARGSAASVFAQLDALDRAVRANHHTLVWCRTEADVRAARRTGRIAVLAGLEGGHALEGELERIRELARRGVRYLSLLHLTPNALGSPAYGIGRRDERGLTQFGREVIAETERAGLILDLAHLNRRGFFEALASSAGVPIVSHAGVAGVRHHPRNIDDQQLRAIAGRGGVVGVMFAPRFLGGDGVNAVAAHLRHIVAVAGEDVPALGSDFDGFVRPPRGLEDVAALPHLTAALLRAGLARRTVIKLLGENVLRVLREVPPREPLLPVQ